MRDALRKYAATSAQLRRAALNKESGVFGALAKGAVNNPGTALMAGLGGLSAVQGAGEAKGKYRQYKAGFDPKVQQSMMGQSPTPPGST